MGEVWSHGPTTGPVRVSGLYTLSAMTGTARRDIPRQQCSRHGVGLFTVGPREDIFSADRISCEINGYGS